MVKEERKMLTVISYVNGQKNITSYFEDGTVRRHVSNNNVEYYAENNVDNSFFIKTSDYSDDIQWQDIDTLIKKHSLGTVLHISVIIRIERRMFRVTTENNITQDNTLYTTIELTLSFGNPCSPVINKVTALYREFLTIFFPLIRMIVRIYGEQIRSYTLYGEKMVS